MVGRQPVARADHAAHRYEQVMFVEVQHGGSSTLDADDLWFYAAFAGSEDGRTWAEAKRDYGGVARLWSFNEPDYATRTPANIPATDTPYESWYTSYCADLPCLE